jgi:hypothetical protein
MTSLLATGLTSVTFGELAVPEEEEDETEEEEDWEQEGRRVSPSLTGNLRKNVGQGKNHQTKPPNRKEISF